MDSRSARSTRIVLQTHLGPGISSVNRQSTNRQSIALAVRLLLDLGQGLHQVRGRSSLSVELEESVFAHNNNVLGLFGGIDHGRVGRCSRNTSRAEPGKRMRGQNLYQY